MAAKVNFNEITKIITVTLAPDASGEIFIDVKTDLYSDGKEDWVLNENLRKFNFPIRSVGGDDLPGSKALGATFFLASDWKIRPYEASHKLVINGNLYSEDGTDPFLDTIGTFTVRIIQQVSSLVDSTVQQLTDIEYASFSGGVTIDVINGQSGTGGAGNPIGNIQNPVDNTSDALIIANERGFDKFFIKGDITLNNYTDFNEVIFVGESKTKSIITIDANADVDKCEFYDSEVTGVLDGGNVLKNCLIGNLNYVNGFIENCVFKTGTITLGGNEEAHFLDCWSGVVGSATPIIDMGGSGQGLGIRNYNGGIKIQNKSGSEKVSIDVNSGHVVLDSTITNGEIIVRGVGTLTDNSTGSVTVDSSGLMSKETISSAVYDEVGGEIQYSSFAGGVSIDISSSNTGTAYPVGNKAFPVNNLTEAIVIANLPTRGFDTLFINKSMTLDNGTDIQGFNIVGKSATTTYIEISSSALCSNISIEKCNVSGTLDGKTTIHESYVGNLNYVNGHIHNCGLYGTIILSGNEEAVLVNCYTVDQDSPPIIDMGGSGQDLAMPNYSGIVTVKNLTSDTEEIGIGIDAGVVILEDTITAGTIIVSGNGILTDNSTGTADVNTDGLMSKQTLTETVWDAIYIDTNCTNSGIGFPIGTTTTPSDNITDAITIANSNSIKTIKLRGMVDIPQTCSAWTFIGLGSVVSDTINLNNQTFESCRFESLTVSGTMTATDTQFVECNVKDISGMNALIRNSSLQGNITMGPPGSVLTGQNLGVRGNTIGAPAVVNMVGAGRSFQANIEGAIQFSNVNVGSFIEVGLNNGVVILDPTCTGGYASFTGVGGNLINYSAMTVTNGLLTESSITDAVLDENIYDHDTISGSLGSTVGKIKKETGLIPALV